MFHINLWKTDSVFKDTIRIGNTFTTLVFLQVSQTETSVSRLKGKKQEEKNKSLYS